MALHRHGCGDDHDNGNDHDDDDHDDHDDAMRHDKLGGSIDVSATGLRFATMRESLHQPISSLYEFKLIHMFFIISEGFIAKHKRKTKLK